MRPIVLIATIVACVPVIATAQPTAGAAEPYRAATTTASGDTGLWFVPTAEVIRPMRFALSGYRTDHDFLPGSTDVAHILLGGSAAPTARLEIFGMLQASTRIDRDTIPLFSDNADGGVVNNYPLVHAGWTEKEDFGDTLLGAKVNVKSQSRGAAAAFALRSVLKIPTGGSHQGISTGRPDVTFDAIVSSEWNYRVEWTAVGGYVIRGDPEDVELTNGVSWGIGVAAPSRRIVRASVELYGEAYTSDVVEVRRELSPGPQFGSVPRLNPQTNPVNMNVALTVMTRRHLFFGAGVQVNWNQSGVEFGSKVGFQVRVGMHPGVLLGR
jgi:hypothetical protein